MINCPGCASTLRFDIRSQMLVCEHCSGSYDPYIFDKTEEDAEKIEMSVFVCPACGAELLRTEENDITTVCPYCSGERIIFDRIAKENRPERIIPFSLTKDDCKEAYKKTARRAFLSPRALKDPERIDGFKGIYMPYWDYGIKTDGIVSITARGPSRRSGDYINTDYYSVEAEVNYTVKGIAHDASKQFDNSISECLAPYREKDEKPFTPGYLCGFYAERDDEDAKKVNFEESENAFRYMIADQIRPETAEKVKEKLIIDESSIKFENKKDGVSRSLYPVWFMSYRKDAKHVTYAAVNGSTGKVVADFPVGKLRFALFAAVIALLLFGSLNISGVMLRPQTCLALTGYISIASYYYCFSDIFREWSERDKIFTEKRKKIPKISPGTKNVLWGMLCFFSFFGVIIFFSKIGEWEHALDGMLVCLIAMIYKPLLMIARSLKIKKIKKGEDADRSSALRPTFLMLCLLPVICLLAYFDKSAATAAAFRTGYYVSGIAYIIYVLKGTNTDNRRGFIMMFCFIISIISVAAGAIVLFFRPLNMFYYCSSALNTVVFFIHIFYMIARVNKRAYRRPVQFNKNRGEK